MKLYASRHKLNTPSLVPRFRTGTNISDISVSKQCSAYLQSSQHRMAQSMPLSIAFAPLIVNCLSYCSADNLYTAISCSSCPQNSTHFLSMVNCILLPTLLYMVFLSVGHIAYVLTRLTMCGESSLSNSATAIVCNVSVSLSFINMVDFKMLYSF